MENNEAEVLIGVLEDISKAKPSVHLTVAKDKIEGLLKRNGWDKKIEDNK